MFVSWKQMMHRGIDDPYDSEPLVLIHGGLTTIGETQGWVQSLAQARRVIAVEMQGHGHTADTDRPMSFATLGNDIAGLLDYLDIPKADRVGHSFGAASAIRAAIQHPDKVRVVYQGPRGHGRGWRRDGRNDDSDPDGPALPTMARAAALPAVSRQDGEALGRGLRLVGRDRRVADAGAAGVC
jgi:pimeloyl-ACP methyl ester carboxylesterase